MENAGYIALSRQIAVRRNLDIVANNLANMTTVGYKAQNIMFEEHLNGKASDKINSFNQVNDYGQYMSTSAGKFQNTGNPLDISIKGNGYMSVETPAGTRYTRNGMFQLNQLGEIVTQQGFPVGSDSNAPITVPQGTNEIKITSKGDVVADGSVVGRIGVFAFENQQDLVQVGNNMYTSEKEPAKDEESTVLQGMLESSNVNPIAEMTKMLSISRSYTGSQKIINDEHERLRGMVRKLGEQ